MKKGLMEKLWMVLVMLSFLSGCAVSSPEEESTTVVNLENGEKVSGEDSRLETSGEEKEETPDGKTASTAEVNVSDREATIFYKGEPFRKSLFAVGGEQLWLCGVKEEGDYFLGYMEKEEDVLQEVDVKPGTDMRALNMVVDRQGRCHILWMSVEKVTINGQNLDRNTFERSCITIVDSDGKEEKEIDVSSIFSEEQPRPYCFVVDEAGNYYFEKGTQLIQILPDGAQGETIQCSGWIEGIGIGKSGNVYCTSRQEGGTVILEKQEEGELRLYSDQLPKANAIYAGIYGGTDTELLLLNKDYGVFAVRDSDGSVETRIAGAQMPVAGEQIGGYGILADGRVCILSQTKENTVFYYIPAGR